MDDEKVISMHTWKKERELEKDWLQDPIPAKPLNTLPLMLASAYWRGNLDGRMEKWRELRWHIVTLIFSNFVSIFALWWALSIRR
jgi:hypothetical protein